MVVLKTRKLLHTSVWKTVQLAADCGIDLTRIKDHRKCRLFASSNMNSLASFSGKIKTDGATRFFWQY